MKTFISFLFVCAGLVAQNPPQVPIQVCWSPQVENARTQCYTVQPDEVAMVTIDGRSVPVQAVVVQPLPKYQTSAMQSHVDGQVYNMQQADGTFEKKQRYQSIQDLIVHNLVKSMIVPVLQLYPPTGADTGKQTSDQVSADLISVLQVFPIFQQLP